mgnify:CR=1 FL=1
MSSSDLQVATDTSIGCPGFSSVIQLTSARILILPRLAGFMEHGSLDLGGDVGRESNQLLDTHSFIFPFIDGTSRREFHDKI